jgi:glycosyltransferase involved in cell wall biosynthesis
MACRNRHDELRKTDGFALPRHPRPLKQMKLLISAYACAPNRGSEWGIGWNWTTEATRLGHQVWALVSPANRDAIERVCQSDAVARSVHWVFPELSFWPLQSGVEPKWERTYNLLWQRLIIRNAQELQREVGFDAIHHLTWGGLRAPTFLGGLGPPLIVGPMGGGETSPALLRDGFDLRGRVLEAVRDLSNSTITLNPVVYGGLAHAAVIFAKTTDTQKILGRYLQEKTIVCSELGIQEAQISAPRTSLGKPLKLLFAGRLIYWKGAHIAIQAFAKLLEKIPDAQFTIVGSGPEQARLKNEALKLGVNKKVNFISWLPQQKLFELYDSHHLFLFPSLHDSSGGVVLEALSRGMPVVCLDIGGPKEIVTPNSGIIVKTAGLSTSQVAQCIADQIQNVCSSQTMWTELSIEAIARAKEFILRDQVNRFYLQVQNSIGTKSQKSA